jgi:tetratricopeptide (TPR) repeat protein
MALSACVAFWVCGSVVLGQPVPTPPVQPAAETVIDVQLTPDDWAKKLIATPNALPKAEMDAARAAIEPAAAADPANTTLMLARGFLLIADGKNAEALKLAREVLKSEPKSSRAWYLAGIGSFNLAQNAPTLDKMGLADDGKEATLKAVELDPTFVDARMSLGMFYVMAPGIAGGSNRKATEQAKAMLELPGGVFDGYSLLALVAADKEEWEEMSAQYQAATNAAETRQERISSILSHARQILNKKEDPAAAISTAKQALALAENDREKSACHFLFAEAKRAQKDRAGAIEDYRFVLKTNPEAANSRWYLAELLAQAKQYAEAAEQYEEFAKRFPKDERAEDASSKGKAMRKKAKQP